MASAGVFVKSWICFRLVFLLGAADSSEKQARLEAEAEQHQDIIQGRSWEVPGHLLYKAGHYCGSQGMTYKYNEGP